MKIPRKINDLSVILILTLTFFATSCMSSSNFLIEGTEKTAYETVSTFLGETEDRAEDGAENFVENLGRGDKQITLINPGCSYVVVRRSDKRNIAGHNEIVIPPRESLVIPINISPWADSGDEFKMQAKPIGEIPIGCEVGNFETEEFDQDRDSEDWEIDF